MLIDAQIIELENRRLSNLADVPMQIELINLLRTRQDIINQMEEDFTNLLPFII